MAAVGPGRFDGDRARKNAPLVTRFRRFGRYRLRGRCRVRLAPQQFERPLLQRRQRAQLRHTVLRSRLQPQLQRRERRQVCQQVREALQRQVPLQHLSRAVLALALLRPHRRAHRPRLPFLPVLVQEQQRRQPLPHVPFQVVRQHADQQVRPHPPLLPVEHRPHRQQRLQRPEGPLHPRQALVRPHRLGVPQLLLLQARADHVDPVQTLLRPDRLLLPPGAERLRLRVERPLEVLAQAPPSQPAQAPVELVAVVAACRVPGRQLLRIRRGQLQQHVALAPPLGRHQRVVADQQPLAGVLLAGHAGQARGVEQPGLDHVALHQLAEGVPAQGGDPVEAGRLEVGVDAGLGDHAAVADQGHALQAEALAQDLHASGEGVRVGGVAGEGLDGDGVALGAAQQAVDDLGAVGAVVAGGELAAGALEVAGGDVVQGEGAGGEVAFRELALDGGLAQGEPVHGVVEVGGGGVAEVEQGGEGGAAGGAEFALDAQLGAGAEQAGDDHGEGEGALAAGPGEEQGVELETVGSAEDGADGAVLAGGAEGEGGAVVAGGELVGEGEAEQVDEVLGEGGEVGEGAFFDLAVFPVGFAEEVAGGLAGVGGSDVHCITKKRRRGNERN